VFLALLHQLEGRIPDRRSVLYHRIADMLLERWDRARARAGGGEVRPAPLGDTWRIAGTLAWWMVDAGRVEIARPALEAELERIELARRESPADARARAASLTELLQHESALLVSAGRGRIRFVHPTLGEYFAGVDLARGGPRWSKVLADPFRAAWHEIVVFCAGELGRRADDERLAALADALARKRRSGGRYGASHPALIGAVLREDPGLATSHQRALVDRLLSLCLDMHFWPASQRPAAQALAEAALVARQRSWYPLLRRGLEDRWARHPFRWEPHHVALAQRALQICSALEIDPQPVIRQMLSSADWRIRLWGWEARLAAADEATRRALLPELQEALDGMSAFPVWHPMLHPTISGLLLAPGTVATR
jgi:hypothetical protein